MLARVLESKIGFGLGIQGSRRVEEGRGRGGHGDFGLSRGGSTSTAHTAREREREREREHTGLTAGLLTLSQAAAAAAAVVTLYTRNRLCCRLQLNEASERASKSSSVQSSSRPV